MSAALGAIGVAAPLVIEPREASNLVFVPVFVCFGAVFLYLGSGFVDLYPDTVVLDGALRVRREIALSDLMSVEPGRFGLGFRVGPDKIIGGPDAVGAKGWLLGLLKVPARGDRIAATIMAAATAARGEPPVIE